MLNDNHPEAPSFAAFSDERLMLEVQKGSHSAYEMVARRVAPMIFRVAFRVVRDQQVAEDVMQQVLLKLWQHAARFDVKRNVQLKSWLFRVTQHAALDALRRQTPNLSSEQSAEPEDQQALPDAQAMQQQLEEEVRRAMDALPERQKLALQLVHFEEVTHAELAQAMECSVKAAESLVIRARRKLHQLLKTSPAWDMMIGLVRE